MNLKEILSESGKAMIPGSISYQGFTNKKPNLDELSGKGFIKMSSTILDVLSCALTYLVPPIFMIYYLNSSESNNSFLTEGVVATEFAGIFVRQMCYRMFKGMKLQDNSKIS